LQAVLRASLERFIAANGTNIDKSFIPGILNSHKHKKPITFHQSFILAFYLHQQLVHKLQFLQYLKKDTYIMTAYLLKNIFDQLQFF
jgi:hypothetical protein